MTSASRTVDIIAHRGASAYAPENTLASFRLASALGADWFELDCTFSADQGIIVIHDDSVDRTTNGQGAVAKLTLAELKRFDAGIKQGPRFAGERLPTLDEALDVAKERGIGVYIEVKNAANDGPLLKQMAEAYGDAAAVTEAHRQKWESIAESSGSRNLDLAQAVIDCVRAHGMERRVVVQSFAPVVCTRVAKCAPEVRNEFLVGRNPKKPDEWRQSLLLAELLTVSGVNPDKGAVTPELVAAVHGRGRRMAVWTVDDPEEMKKLVTMGVDALITNRPDVALKTLEDMGLRTPCCAMPAPK